MAIFLCYDEFQQPEYRQELSFLLMRKHHSFFMTEFLEKVLTVPNWNDIINIVPCEGGGMADAPA